MSLKTLIEKTIRGGPGRKTRLHTERGDLIDVRELRHLPLAALGKLTSVLTGRRPDEPWWPMSVIPVIDDFLVPSSEVIEFGAGSSTVWLARRAARIISIEDNPEWCSKINKRIAHLGLENVEVRLKQRDTYCDLRDLEGRRFDLAAVDGSYRWKCVAAVLPLMKPGGVIYLDNSDADKDKVCYTDPHADRLAQEFMESYAATTPGASLARFSSLINGEVHAGEGMILRTPGQNVRAPDC